MIFSAKEKEWKRIISVFPDPINQLVNLGYQKYQIIDTINRNIPDGKKVSQLTESEIADLQNALTQWILFAAKCRDSLKY